MKEECFESQEGAVVYSPYNLCENWDFLLKHKIVFDRHFQNLHTIRIKNILMYRVALQSLQMKLEP